MRTIRTSEDIYVLLKEMAAYARQFPAAEFLCADSPADQRIGWLGFGGDPDEEILWTVPVEQVKEQFRRGQDRPMTLLGGQESKVRFLVEFIRSARAAPPGPTVWERLLAAE